MSESYWDYLYVNRKWPKTLRKCKKHKKMFCCECRYSIPEEKKKEVNEEFMERIKS